MLISLVLTIINLIQIEAVSLKCYNSSDDFTVTPLTTPLALINSPFFDLNRKTVIYTFGFEASTKSIKTIAIRDAYVNNVDANFIILDWEEEASGGKLGAIAYPIKVVPNTKKIGEQLGEAILELANVGLDLSILHLVGHSLGAHLMGYAGYLVKEAGKSVARITGLDPAGPLYTGPLSFQGLEATSATFVDAIHTAPGTCGTTDNVGVVDIWVNCDLREQPGCGNGTGPPFTQEDFCSHNRAPHIFAESLGNPTAFPAIEASSCIDWKNNNVDGNIVYMGENIDVQARGKFYLNTHSEEPFGMGDGGLQS